MAGKLYIQTYGCQMNEYDSQKIADVLRESHGLSLTERPEEADVLLLNTCSIREKAQEKVYSQLGRWKPWKQQRPGLLIGVGGCVASQEGAAIRDRAPYVDLVFGPQTLHRLPDLVAAARRTGLPQVDVSFPEIEKFDRLPEPRAEGPTAFVSVMEGCSKYCTYCVVPYTRGEEVSRPFDDVIAEVATLAAQGVREVNLLGQNVNAYRGRTHDGERADLALLIRYVAAIDGIDRIRFTTSHPVEMSDALIETYAEVPELVSFLHLPVQSGSDRILMAMKRGHTGGTTSRRSASCARRGPGSPSPPTSSWASPARPPRTSSTPCGSSTRSASTSRSALYTAAGPARPPPTTRTTCRSRRSSGGSTGSRRRSTPSPPESAARWSAACSGSSSTGRRARTPASCRAGPRTTASSTSRVPPASSAGSPTC